MLSNFKVVAMLSKQSLDSGRKAVVCSAIAFFIVALLLTLHRHFSFYSSYDQGIFNQVFWNGTHGNFFQSTLSSQLSTNVIHGGEVADVSYRRLGQHFTPALLLWLPIYYLFPYPATLTVLQVCFVTAAGLVLYQLGRIYLEPAIAVMIVFSFYGANAILGPTLGNFHDLAQIPLFMFSLLWAMEKRRWWLFAIFAVCILSVREDSGITLFGVGVYLILSRRYPKLGLGVCSIGFGYVLSLTNLIMPLFSADISQRFMLENFGQYATGDRASTLEILFNMVTNPGILLRELFTPFGSTLKYLLGQWLPLAFIPVFAPGSWAIAIFPLAKLLLSQGDLVLSISIRYAMSVTPGLFYGSILWWAGQGFGNITKPLAKCQPRKLRPKFRRFWIFCICLSLLFTVTSNPSQTLYFLIPDSIQPRVFVSAPQQWQRTREINSLIAQIPANASVSATSYIIPHLSSRRSIIRLPGLEIKGDDQKIESVDYLVADLWRMKYYQTVFDSYRRDLQAIAPLIDEVIKNKQYGVVGFKQGVVLLKKNTRSNPQNLAAWQDYFSLLDFTLS